MAITIYKKHISCFVITILFYSAALASQDIDQEIALFIKDFQNSSLALQLSKEEFEKAWSEEGVAGVYQAKAEKILNELPSDMSADDQKKELDKQREVRESFSDRADRIAFNVLQQGPAEINKYIHVFLFRSLIDPEPTVSSALYLVLNSINSYRFSQEEERRLLKESKALHQFHRAGVRTWLAALGLAGLIAIKHRIPPSEILSAMKSAWKSPLKSLQSGVRRLTEKAASKSDDVMGSLAKPKPGQRVTEEQIARLSRKEVLELLPGEISKAFPEISKDGSTFAKMFSRRRLLHSLKDKPAPVWFKNLLYSVGFYAAGGTAGVGYNTLLNITVDPSFSNTVVSLPDLSEYYSGLDVLLLNCRTRDFLIRVKMAESIEINVDEAKSMAKDLNSLYAEYAQLKRLYNGMYLDTITLPKDFRFEKETALVKYHVFPALNYKINEEPLKMEKSFQCEKLKDADLSMGIQVNLLESLYELTAAFAILRDISVSDQTADEEIQLLWDESSNTN